jgi:hypothetical protein
VSRLLRAVVLNLQQVRAAESIAYEDDPEALASFTQLKQGLDHRHLEMDYGRQA